MKKILQSLGINIAQKANKEIGYGYSHHIDFDLRPNQRGFCYLISEIGIKKFQNTDDEGLGVWVSMQYLDDYPNRDRINISVRVSKIVGEIFEDYDEYYTVKDGFIDVDYDKFKERLIQFIKDSEDLIVDQINNHYI